MYMCLSVTVLKTHGTLDASSVKQTFESLCSRTFNFTPYERPGAPGLLGGARGRVKRAMISD